MRIIPLLLFIVFVQIIFIAVPKAQAYSNPAAVSLLTVDNFTALAKSAITNPVAGTVLNNGDMGLDSPATCTGFSSPCTGVTTNGTINNGVIQYQNAVALQGQTDSTAVVSNLNGRTADDTIAGGLLDGLTLAQGVYDVPATATNLTGTLTLSGDANSVFIFRASSSLITANTSSIVLTGGAQACNVFWTVGSSATFDGATDFVGTVLAATSIDFTGGGATLEGRAIAQTAAITFRNTTVNNPSCATASSSSSSSSSSSDEDDDDENEADIKVVKTASPATLSTGPGSVTYTYKVTNPGDISLRHVSVRDDKCSPVQFVSGDSNNNKRLGLDEVWIYTCTKKVSQTETNKATARGAGSENGEYVHDTDTVTIAVAPRLPGAGFASDETSTPGHMLSYIFALPSFLLKLIR